MNFIIVFTDTAKKDIAFLKQKKPILYKKVLTLLKELKDHPYTGTGKPKPLKHELKGNWSRRISHKHRLVYSVNDNEVSVLVISAEGHYNDK